MAKILLSEWAKRNKVSPRTASNWAHRGHIKATKGNLKVRYEGVKTLHGYLVSETTKVPKFDKSSSKAKVAKQPKQ